jgi:hypothetical protein
VRQGGYPRLGIGWFPHLIGMAIKVKNNFLSWALVVGAAFVPSLAIAQGNGVNLSPGFKSDPVKFQGTTAGKVSLAQLSGGVSGKCRGYSQEQPNYVLNLPENLMLDILVFSPDLNTDSTMLIKSANGTVVCADDEYQGRHPQITRRRFGRGVYQVWIGSGDAQKPVNFTLSLSEFLQK